MVSFGPNSVQSHKHRSVFSGPWSNTRCARISIAIQVNHRQPQFGCGPTTRWLSVDSHCGRSRSDRGSPDGFRMVCPGANPGKRPLQEAGLPTPPCSLLKPRSFLFDVCGTQSPDRAWLASAINLNRRFGQVLDTLALASHGLASCQWLPSIDTGPETRFAC